MGFFGYWGEKMDDAIAGLKTDISAMKVDAETYEKEAKRLEDEAERFQKIAANDESTAASLKLTKTVTSSTPNEDGTYDEEEVDDEDAINRKKELLADAKKKREDAAKDRENAAEYRTLAAGLWLLKGNMEEAAKNWELARENIKAAIVNSTKSLEAGTNILRNAISTFNMPSVKSIGNWANNLLKEYIGIDLSDGFGAKDLYGISGKLIETGAITVKGFASLAVISTIGVLPGLGEISLGIINDLVNPTIDKIFDEGAVKVVYNGFTSGLGFLGITFEEKEGQETATIGTGDIQDKLEENYQEITPTTEVTDGGGDAAVVENDSQGAITETEDGNNGDKRVSQKELNELGAQKDALEKEIAFQEKQRDYAQREYEKNISKMEYYINKSKSDESTEIKEYSDKQIILLRQRSISDKRNKQNAIENIRTLQVNLDEVNEKWKKLNADAEKYGTR